MNKSSSRSILATLCGLILIGFLAACGSGGYDDGPPRNVTDLSVAFFSAPIFLQDYFSEVKDGGTSSNADTIMTREEISKPYSYFSHSLQIQYKGTVIYDEELVKGVPVAAHGFASSGEYLIVVNRLYSNATYASVFVNGQRVMRLETELFHTDFGSIRDLGNGWIVLVTDYFVECSWKLYSLKTDEFLDYGLATCPKKFEP